MRLQIKRLRESARLPSRATPGSAGYDLFADLPEPLEIPPGEAGRVGTGIAAAPEDASCVLLVFGRSGLAVKHGLAPANAVGVVDSDYRGEIAVWLRNFSREPYTVRPGDRIAQLVAVPVLETEVEETAELPESVRGDGGFGSTGR